MNRPNRAISGRYSAKCGNDGFKEAIPFATRSTALSRASRFGPAAGVMPVPKASRTKAEIRGSFIVRPGREISCPRVPFRRTDARKLELPREIHGRQCKNAFCRSPGMGFYGPGPPNLVGSWARFRKPGNAFPGGKDGGDPGFSIQVKIQGKTARRAG